MAGSNVSAMITELAKNGTITAEQSVTMYISASLTLVFFGVIGNIFSLIVWSRGTRCKNLQSSMYFKILALSDLIVLVICVGNVIALRILRYNFENLEHKIRCKLFVAIWFAEELGPEISPWIIVFLSMERALSMMFPLKFSGKFAKRRALISFGCIMVALVLLQLIWVFSIEYDDNQDSYIPTDESASNMITIKTYSKIVVLCAIPLFLIIFCNALIVFRLFRMRKMGSATNDSQRNRRFATFTVLTIVTGILHCVSVTPSAIYNIAMLCVNTDVLRNSFSHEWCWSVFFDGLFWAVVSLMFLYMNNAFNFYFYCLAGRDFRADLKDILCCRNRTATRNNIGSPIEM